MTTITPTTPGMGTVTSLRSVDNWPEPTTWVPGDKHPVRVACGHWAPDIISDVVSVDDAGAATSTPVRKPATDCRFACDKRAKLRK